MKSAQQKNRHNTFTRRLFVAVGISALIGGGAFMLSKRNPSIEDCLKEFGNEIGINPNIAEIVYDPTYEQYHAYLGQRMTISNMDLKKDANGQIYEATYQKVKMSPAKILESEQIARHVPALCEPQEEALGNGLKSKIFVFGDSIMREGPVVAKSILVHEYQHANDDHFGIKLGDLRIDENNFHFFKAIKVNNHKLPYDRCDLLKLILELRAYGDEVIYLHQNGIEHTGITRLYADHLDTLQEFADILSKSERIFARFSESQYVRALLDEHSKNGILRNAYERALLQRK